MRAAATALVAVALAHVAGAWLVARDDETTVSWTIIRVIAGLLLLTVAFLLCLVLPLPWFLGPAAVLVASVLRHRLDAVRVPRPKLSLSRDAVVAAMLGAILVAPIIISAARMAPGGVPPVFFNVDTPYSLEHVHALTKTTTYPPPSLGNAGGGRSYHFATAGAAALIARSTGLRPHHSLFGIVLPLMAIGILAAGFAAARAIAPAVPATLAVPLLLITVPSFWYSFSNVAGPMLWQAITMGQSAPLDALTENYELWGPASIVAPNVGAHLLVLASLAAIAAGPARGWTLAVFLVGIGILVKVSAGVALIAGFLLVQAWLAVTTRQLQPARPALAAAAVFFLTYLAFWIVPATPPDFAVEPFAMFHLQRIAERGGLTGLAFDLGWVMLPVLALALAGITDPERRSLPLLLFALAPLIIVNCTASIDQRPGGGGASDDWLQLLLPMPFILHAFVLAFASARWTRLPAVWRAIFVGLVACALAPPLFVAGRYSRLLVREPENGHEFVDNRDLAPALAAIPVDGTLIVTNDLRYPAQRFGRDNRQMQIPALYGHQAFAVNYAYEVYSFSPERRPLQALLQADRWTRAIDDAARAHGWTHLVIRKDYRHPSPIPLQGIFENEHYAVYRF